MASRIAKKLAETNGAPDKRKTTRSEGSQGIRAHL